MQIRLAKEEDNKTVSKILQNLKDDYYPYKMLSPSYILEKIRFKNDFFFIAEDDSSMGVIRACIIDVDLAELRMLFVDEKHRNQGIGMNLIKESLDFLKSKNMRKVIARVKSDNKSAISILKKLGFKEEGYFKEHYRKGVDIVQMYKFLE